MKNKFNAAAMILSLVLLASNSFAQGAGVAMSTEDVKNTLTASRATGPWWGAGIDFRNVGCSVDDKCTGAQAVQFNTTSPGKLGVAIFGTTGSRPYKAYLKGARFPGDTQQSSMGRQWVTVNDNGSFAWSDQSRAWKNCRIKDPNQFDCDWSLDQYGARAALHFYRLPAGPSPTAWPE